MEQPILLSNPNGLLEGNPCLRLNSLETMEGTWDTGGQVQSRTLMSAVCFHSTPGRSKLSNDAIVSKCYYLICTFKLIL